VHTTTCDQQSGRLMVRPSGGVSVVTHLLFMAAFSLAGYPRLQQNSQAPTRPCTARVGRFTATASLLTIRWIIVNDWWTSRFCSVAKALAPRLAASRLCSVDGVSSAP
jgi:hypothetical protein